MGTPNGQCGILVTGSGHSPINCYMCYVGLTIAIFGYQILVYGRQFSRPGCSAQAVIGWQNFVEGKIAKEWGQLEEHHYVHLKSQCTADHWTSGTHLATFGINAWYMDPLKQNTT